MRASFLGSLGLLFSACGTQAPVPTAPSGLEARGAGLSDDEGLPPIDGVNAACPGTRWIGVLPQGRARCPAPPNPAWRVAPLFADENGDPQGDGRIPKPLDRYCAYEWVGDGAPPQRRPAFANRVDDQGWLAADCHTVGAQSPSRDVLWRDLVASHQVQNGAVVPLPSRPGAAAVRIAVADSATRDYEGGRPSYGQLEHGRAVGLVARHLACPPEGGPCNGFVSSHLALARDEDGTVNRQDGGFYGFQSEVAQAIYAAVRDWQAQRTWPNGQQRLVINLSVGWSGAYGGTYANDDWETLRPAVRAVHEAVRWARCNGALVIAASGNSTFGPAPEAGALFPAGWERKRAPTAAECRAMGDVVASRDRPAFAHNAPGAPPTYEALLFAASGVDPMDAPLYNARPLARARLAAPAFHVVARDFDPNDTGAIGAPQPTQAYTGSSMAAAVVSGVAASVWALAPDLAPAQVVEVLHRSGVTLTGLPAQLCRGASCGDVRRVSQCRALADLCAARPGACSFVPGCAGTVPAFAGSHVVADPETDADGDGVRDLDEALPSAAIAAGVLAADTTAGCDGGPVHYVPDSSTAGPPADACPQEARPAGGSAPWVGPQPDDHGCDVCYLIGRDVYLNISSSLTVSLQDATLTRYDGSGNVIDSVRLDTLDPKMDPLTPGEYVKVSGLPSTGFRVARSATMSFMNGSKPYSSISPVLVY